MDTGPVGKHWLENFILRNPPIRALFEVKPPTVQGADVQQAVAKEYFVEQFFVAKDVAEEAVDQQAESTSESFTSSRPDSTASSTVPTIQNS